MPNTSAGVCTFADVFTQEVRKRKNGTKELARAMRSWDFGDTGNSSVFNSNAFIEKISRRKFQCDPSVKLDIALYDHYLSLVLETICKIIRHNKGDEYRKVLVEYIPDILAVISPEERDLISRKVALIFDKKETKLKLSQKKKTSVSETPKPGILESIPIQAIQNVVEPIHQAQVQQAPIQPQWSVPNTASQPAPQSIPQSQQIP